MPDDLGDQKALVLAGAGVVERPGHDDRQALEPGCNHVFHRQLAAGVMVDRGRADILVDHFYAGSAIDVGAAGDKDALRSFLLLGEAASRLSVPKTFTR